MSDNDEPKKKKGGFISTQDMWELSLDMVGDDDIDSLNRTSEIKRVRKDAPEQGQDSESLKPQAAIDSRASVLPATSRQKIQPQSGTTARPKAKANTPLASTSPAPRKKKVAQAPTQTAAASKPRQSPSKPSTKPAGLSAIQKQAAGNGAAARKVIKEPPVISLDQPPRKQEKPVRKEASKKQSETRKQPSPEPATFEARDVTSVATGAHSLDIDGYDKGAGRQKFLKMADGVWSLGGLFWVVFSWVFKFFYRNKFSAIAVVISFILGVYVGELDDSVLKLASFEKMGKTTTLNKQKAVKKILKKKVKKQIVKKKKAPAPAVVEELPGQMPAEVEPVDESLANNRFDGKDIIFEDTIQKNSLDVGGDQLSGSDDGDNVTSVSDESIDNIMAPEAENLFSDESVPPTEIEVPVTEGKTNPVDITSDQQAEIQALFNKNVRKFDAGEWLDVVSLSNQILEINPRHISAFINRSIAYTELGSFDLAIDDANTVISMDKDNAVSYNNRGYAYERAGLIDQAISDYEFACTLGVEMSCQEVTRLRRTSQDSEAE